MWKDSSSSHSRCSRSSAFLLQDDTLVEDDEDDCIFVNDDDEDDEPILELELVDHHFHNHHQHHHRSHHLSRDNNHSCESLQDDIPVKSTTTTTATATTTTSRTSMIRPRTSLVVPTRTSLAAAAAASKATARNSRISAAEQRMNAILLVNAPRTRTFREHHHNQNSAEEEEDVEDDDACGELLPLLQRQPQPQKGNKPTTESSSSSSSTNTTTQKSSLHHATVAPRTARFSRVSYAVAAPEEHTTTTPTASAINAPHLETELIHIMDRMEDNMESHTYEDLVPLDVKLALEDKVFGWTHLSSTFLGHAAFVLGTYWLVYYLVTIFVCNILPLLAISSSSTTNDGSGGTGNNGTDTFCLATSFIHSRRHSMGEDSNTTTGTLSSTSMPFLKDSDDYYYNNTATTTTTTAVPGYLSRFLLVNFFLPWDPLDFTRVLLAFIAAVSAYRMVRRRRRIWFRASYGSKAYMQLSERKRRRKSVKETDKKTRVGQMISRMLHRHVQRKLKKAETMFAKKLQRKRLKEKEKEERQLKFQQDEMLRQQEQQEPRDLPEYDPDDIYGYNDYDNRHDNQNNGSPRSLGETLATAHTDEITTTTSGDESSPLLLPRGGSTLSGEEDEAETTESSFTSSSNNNKKMLDKSQSSMSLESNCSLDSSGSASDDMAEDDEIDSSSSSMSDGMDASGLQLSLAKSTSSAVTTTPRSMRMAMNRLEEEMVSPEPPPDLGERRRRKPRRPSFHTDPTNRMQSIAHDQILFQRIQNIPYSHGGFFATAPFLLANPHWISILRHLMPDVYVEIARRAAYSPASKLIHWAENNPVVAAYGAAQELENNYVSSSSSSSALMMEVNQCSKDQASGGFDGNNSSNNNIKTGNDEIGKSSIPNLEWDVFLDPYLVQRVEVVLQERDKYLASMQQEEDRELKDASENPVVDATTQIRLDKQREAKQEQHNNILAYYEYQLKRRSQAMVDKMLIAHGNLNHLIIEQTGWAKHFNYSRVKRSRRTLGGGIYARQWLAVFAEALKLGNTSTGGSANNSDMWDDPATAMNAATPCTLGTSHKDSKTKPSRVTKLHNGLKRVSSYHSSLLTLAESKCPEMTMAEAIHTVQSICRSSQPVGLILDLKSRHVPKRIWAVVVDTLRYAGVRVEGIGAFALEEIGDISSYCVTGPVREICFFHSAGDLQLACHNGKIRQGDTVFLNAGSLLWEPSAGSMATKMVKTVCTPFDPEEVKNTYKVLPYGLPPGELPKANNDKNSCGTPSSAFSTIAAYKKRYQLSIGLYCQEFAIDEAAVNLLAKLVNEHPEIYNLGMSWGGVNGITIRGICPGRFTATDGYWNQRAIGSPWDCTLTPPGFEGPVDTEKEAKED